MPNNFFRSWPKHGYRQKVVPFFFGPKFWFLAQKSDFCHTTPILVDDPFLALSMTVNFPRWERFFDFPFRSSSISGPVKKSSPLPLWGHRLPVKALALSARRPFGPARGLDKFLRQSRSKFSFRISTKLQPKNLVQNSA